MKRSGEEETGYHKPFSFDLKEVMSSNGTFWKPTVSIMVYVHILGKIELGFRISRTKFF